MDAPRAAGAGAGDGAASSLPTCDRYGWGLLPHGKGLTPCTSQLLLAAVPCLYVLLAGGLRWVWARRDYHVVFPPIDWRLRAKLLLSVSTLALEIAILVGMFAWPSIHRQMASIVAVASSSVRVVAWGFQICLQYTLHWRALPSSELSRFWLLWFVFVATACISESIVESDGLTPSAYRFFIIVVATRFAASAGLAISVLCPNNMAGIKPAFKSQSLYFPFGATGPSIHTSSSSFNQPFLSSFDRRGGRDAGINSATGAYRYSVVRSGSPPNIFAGGATSSSQVINIHAGNKTRNNIRAANIWKGWRTWMRRFSTAPTEANRGSPCSIHRLRCPSLSRTWRPVALLAIIG